MPQSGFASNIKIPHPHRLKQDATKERIGHISQFSRSIRGSIRPCGKGTIGYAPQKKVSKLEAEYDRASQEVIAVEYQAADPSTGELSDGIVRVDQATDEALYSLPCQESQPVAREPRIADNLTARGKKYIEDGCFLLERKYGVTNLGFYTLTLSINNKVDNDEFNSQAATILKRFLEKVKRYYEKSGQTWLYIGVWEIHPSRSFRVGYPVLHFHYVAPCYISGTKQFVLTSSQVRDFWSSTIRSTGNIRLERECRVGSEVCRKNCGGYLAKYYCKGNSGALGEIPEFNQCPLSSWYSLSRNLLDLIRRCTIPVGRFIGGDNERANIPDFLSDYTSVSGEIVKNIDGRDVILGYWFVLNPYFHGCTLVEVDTILMKS
jgi:hypothetical protein